jgi:hypothetical protein
MKSKENVNIWRAYRYGQHDQYNNKEVHELKKWDVITHETGSSEYFLLL